MKIQNYLITIATKVLRNESEAINNLIQYLNSEFESCVEHILNLKGRVIITGIGKSSIVAQKIVATLNSTGTPAVFMHAADAIHGDLGIIQKGDSVICISKSGNTPEIKVLVPLIKRMDVPLIGMVSNTDSYLAKHSDYILNTTIGEEACPNNLAPTTSTTVQMAMGDALAVCLLKSRNFGPEDFAKYHPGGALGKKLYLLVDDIIQDNEIPTVEEGAGFESVVLEISSKRLGATAVVNNNGELTGIITDGDLRRSFGKTDFKTMTATSIMTGNPKTVVLGTFATQALEIMQNHNITQLIVVNEHNSPKGFVHLHDLLREGIYN